MADAALALVPESAPGPLAVATEAARNYLRQAKADNTLRAYRADWAHFKNWCAVHELAPLLAQEETLVLYFSELAATHKVSTLQRRLASISQAHQVAGFETPTRGPVIRNLLAGIRRAKGTAPAVKTPALTEDLRLMVRAMPDSLLGYRDRALLLVGFAGAFRRSELVSLDVEDLAFEREGIVVTLRRSKTDPEGQGRKIGIPLGSGKTCPVRALEKWMEAARIEEGPLFRPVTRHGHVEESRLSDKAVALIVKRWAQAVGLDARKYAGHSLRSGLATSAARNGASERSIMNQTGHRSVQMVRRYIREGTVFEENAAGKVGL
jgi:site-specific recombinase XerD